MVITQFSRRTEIMVDIKDFDNFKKAMKDFEIEYEIINSDNELIYIKTFKRLGLTAINFLKKRIAPKIIQNKPKTKKKVVYDYNIVVGIDRDMKFIYKKI